MEAGGRRGNFEFSVADPQKQIPFIYHFEFQKQTLLCALPVFPKAIGVDCDVRLTIKKLLFALRANLTLNIGNCEDTRLHPCPEGLSHPPDTAAATARTACKGRYFHVDRFAETRI